MAKLIKLGITMTKGEQRAFDYLEKALPDGWTVLANFQLPIPAGGSIEIDAVVIGDRGVWVADEKGFGGVIRGDEHSWILSDGSVRERPLDRVLQVARIVKGRISTFHPSLRDTWVQGLVLLSADDADTRKISDARIAKTVRRLAGCEQYFLNAQLGRSISLSAHEQQRVIEALCGYTKRTVSRGFSTVNDFTLLEKLDTQSTDAVTIAVFKARHAVTDSTAELRIVDVSGIPEKERQAAKAWLTREVTTLQNLRHVSGVVRLIENVKEIPGFDGSLLYFATDLPEGPVLAEKLSDSNWTPLARLEASVSLVKIIQNIHKQGVVHRNLSPATIHCFGSDTDFLVSGFRLARSPKMETTIPIDSEHPSCGPYTAPELISSIHSATQASDVYSLGTIIFEILTGVRPFPNTRTLKDDALPWDDVPHDLVTAPWFTDFRSIVDWMTNVDPAERLQNADDVLALLADIYRQVSDPGGEGAPARQRPQSHPLAPNSALDSFRIIRALPSGGCFHVYLVRSEESDGEPYVAKVIRFPELLVQARREFLALAQLDHDNIVKALEVRERVDAAYQLLERFVPGPTLHDIIAEGAVDEARAKAWLIQILDALVFMESRRPAIHHGDLSPRNIIISTTNEMQSEKATLVDFGLAWFENETRDDGIVGTAPYRPPERDRAGSEWPGNGDLYSLGVIICQALFGELPFETDGSTYFKHKVREALFTGSNSHSEALLRILRMAIDPDGSLRFQTAAAMLEELSLAEQDHDGVHVPQQVRGTNRRLAELIKLFSQGKGNSENRGLDSAFAAETYVPTSLDQTLLPQILDRKFALVILTGNPGDGKTAFLQQIARRLGLRGALPLHHWDLTDETGWRFEAVLDGSASDSERNLTSSTAVLDAIFNPLSAAIDSGLSIADLKRTYFIAINDGRLLEYLHESNVEGRGHFFSGLVDALEGSDADLHPAISLINLNARSLVWGPGDTFEQTLTLLVDGPPRNGTLEDPWASCSTCRASGTCHVRFNVETLRDSQVGPIVRDRLRALLLLVHGRGRLHLTMRELRSTLAYIFFGEMSCDDIHSDLEETLIDESGSDPHGDAYIIERKELSRTGRLYFNRAFSGAEVGSRLLSELARFDPGKGDEPRIDRLIRAKSRNRRGLEDLMLSALGRRPHSDLEELGASYESAPSQRDKDKADRRMAKAFADARRRLYFESSNELSGSSEDLTPWLRLTPYRHAEEWFSALGQSLKDRHFSNELRDRICRGISLSDNASEGIARSFLAVRTVRSVKTELLVMRLYDLANFELSWSMPIGFSSVNGTLPDYMSLKYSSASGTSLDITADLFEVLMRLADGYHVGAGELEAVAAHLQTFKNRLLAEATDKVRLVHPRIAEVEVRVVMRNEARMLVFEKVAT
jgi:serine/threonine protein kinase